MNCALCNEEIKGDGVKLGGGKTICKDCNDFSAMVRTCDGCGKEFLVTDLANDPYTGIFCAACFREMIKENDFMTWEDWLEGCEEDGTEPTKEGFLEWYKDTCWADLSEKDPYRWILNQMIEEELKKAEKAA